MEWTTTAEVALIGGTVGLGAYCFSCAAHVWRGRNARQRGTRTPGRLLTAIRRGAGVVVVGGMLGMAVSVGWWVAAPREGLLEGEGLFTVRRPAGLEVVYLAPESRVEKAAVLARFHSPEAEAEIAVLELRRESLAAEKQVLRHQVLTVDPEIAQRLADVNAQERTLRTNLSDLTLEKERLEREALREQLARQVEVKKRELDIRKLDAETEQVQRTLQLCREDHVRLESLRERNVVSEQQHAEKAAELDSLQIEVRKLQEQLQQTREQKAELEQGLERFEQLSNQQARDLQASIDLVENRLEKAALAQRELQDRRNADLRRAARHRDELLNRLVIETSQSEKQLAAEQEKLEKRAPFAGDIAYRAPAPGNAGSDDPLVVVTPSDGMRLSVRLPRWMKPPLEDTAEVSWKLLEDLESDDQRRFVESRFTACLHRWEDLAAHPGYGLAEFTCDAPAEAVRLLARGEQIAARLVWRPPLDTMPAFMVSLAIASVAGVVWVTTHAQSKPSPPRPVGPPSEHGRAVVCDVATEYGEQGALLRLLGTQLREMTSRGELDEHVIAAAEWALTRHRHRAVRLLAAGLGDGPGLCEHLEALVKSVALEESTSNGHAQGRRSLALERLLAVFRAAAPEGSYEQIRRIGRTWSRSPVRNSNGRRHDFEFPAPDSHHQASVRDRARQ